MSVQQLHACLDQLMVVVGQRKVLKHLGVFWGGGAFGQSFVTCWWKGRVRGSTSVQQLRARLDQLVVVVRRGWGGLGGGHSDCKPG
jgi:hypothetical protein